MELIMSVSREGYERVMSEFSDKLRQERKERTEKNEDNSFTEFEALMMELVRILMTDIKCRTVMEYDPAGDRVRFFRER